MQAKASRAMEIVSVRFGTDQIEVIRSAAALDGVSASQFIRDSSYARAVLELAKRNAVTIQLFESLIAVVESEGHEVLAAKLADALDGLQGDG